MRASLVSPLISSVPLHDYLRLVSPVQCAVCRVVVGLLEIFSKVPSTSDVSFQEPGIKDS